jgi:glycerophosphoryl diester phosphodiesterase
MKTNLLLVLGLLIMEANAVEIIAHRGYSQLAPENTVAAFELAWKSGTDACELDLYLTADEQIVVIHDADAQRTTGVAAKIKESTVAELRQLDAGAWKEPKFKGQRIPTLQEALATLPEGHRRFFLEIKDTARIVPFLAKELESWKPRAGQLCLIAFDRAVARDAKAAMPWLPVYRLSTELTPDLIRSAKEDGLDGLDLGQKSPLTPALVQEIRDAGLKLYVWTVNKPEDVSRFAALGVDGITTDDPVMARAAVLGS